MLIKTLLWSLAMTTPAFAAPQFFVCTPKTACVDTLDCQADAKHGFYLAIDTDQAAMNPIGGSEVQLTRIGGKIDFATTYLGKDQGQFALLTVKEDHSFVLSAHLIGDDVSAESFFGTCEARN